MNHSLPGQVTLAQAMAFSCNTTYMPLAFSRLPAERDGADRPALRIRLRRANRHHLPGRGDRDRPRRRLAGRERARRLLRLRAGPAGDRPGGVPRHAAAAGERVRRHRQRRHALDAAHPHDCHAARWDRDRDGRADGGARDLGHPGGPCLRDRYAGGGDDAPVRHRVPPPSPASAFPSPASPAPPRRARPIRMPGSPPTLPRTIRPSASPPSCPTSPLGTGGTDAAPLVRRVMATHFAGS